nr:MAG TPA: hypothetical protein [Caudoviricetes sp.]DAU60558.1 MAG TPA: hypothetical protein [Caudoviricetes sp.]
MPFSSWRRFDAMASVRHSSGVCRVCQKTTLPL